MYEWIKALHVIAEISWMAGMLYLPRLFVYHCEADVGSKQSGGDPPVEGARVVGAIRPPPPKPADQSTKIITAPASRFILAARTRPSSAGRWMPTPSAS